MEKIKSVFTDFSYTASIWHLVLFFLYFVLDLIYPFINFVFMYKFSLDTYVFTLKFGWKNKNIGVAI